MCVCGFYHFNEFFVCFSGNCFFQFQKVFNGSIVFFLKIVKARCQFGHKEYRYKEIQ